MSALGGVAPTLSRRVRVLMLGLVAAGVALVADVGCGSTGSKRFVFDARAGGIERPPSQPYTFTNANGWTVTLTRAKFTFGPVYLNVVAPLRSPTAAHLSLVRSARASNDHLGSGRIVGEVLGQVAVDALSPALVPFGTQGTITQEQVRTAEIWFWPPPGVAPETTDIDSVAVDVAGAAIRGDVQVRFRGALVFDEEWASSAEPGQHSATPITEIRRVRGIPSAFFPDEGGALEIRVDARPLFEGAEFASLDESPTDADGTKVLVQSKSGVRTTDQVMKNIYAGLRTSSGTYAVRWVVP